MVATPGRFRALHDGSRPLLVPNPWDVGSAVLLERLGFDALATTSSGMAFSLGGPDGSIAAEQALAYCERLCAATTVPVTGDLESGYGDAPERVADLVGRAAGVGLAGCSIEDFTGRPDDPIYPEGQAVERVAAAVEAARAGTDDFVLTARCESLLWTDWDLDRVISRLQAYAHVGADVVYAPGLATLDDISAVCRAIDRPVNVGLEMPSKPTVEELADAGVRRISVGAVFARQAYGGLVEAARELLGRGTLDAAADAMDYDELEALFR